MKINAKELRQKTDQAIIQGEKQRLQKLAAIEAKEKQKQLEDSIKADSIIEQIPSRCAKEAESGRDYAIVMSLKWMDDYKQPESNGNLKPEELFGAGKLVWNACVEAELNPTIEYWWSGDGMESGYNIVVHW